MAINKNFVIKHGVEVFGDLIYADPDTDRVGIGTTQPEYSLHVNGGIGATNLNVSGIATFTTLVATSATISSLTISTVPSTVAFTTITADKVDPLNLDLTGSTITIGGTTGTNGQYLVSTGTGVNWISTPTARTSTTIIAAPAQTSISYTYTVGLVDVYINGVKLSTSEFTATDGATITLNDACFGGETIEVIAYAVSSLGAGTSGIQGITVQNQGITTGSPLSITSVNFVGSSVTAVGNGVGVTVYVSDYWESTSAGINTLSNVGLGTTNPNYYLEVGPVGYADTALWVNGDARVTGILTIGTSSITLDGSANTINVGAGVTIDGDGGTISATSIIVDGTTLTGAAVTYITAGSGISVDQSTGNVTITATGGGGSSSQWETTAAGIHTLSNVGIGTTNPTSALTVTGSGTSTSQLYVTGISTFRGSNSTNVHLGNTGYYSGLTWSGSSGSYGGTEPSILTNSGLGLDISGGLADLTLSAPTSGGDVIIKAGNLAPTAISCIGNAQVEINHNGSKKFETLGTGVTVTGTTFTNQLSVSGVSTFQNGYKVTGGNSYYSDDVRLYFGNDSDIFIGHQTIPSPINYIAGANNIPLTIWSDNLTLGAQNGENFATFITNGSASLYYDNSKKFETTGAGVTITGTTFTNQLSVSGISTFIDDVKISEGSSLDFGSGAGDLHIYRQSGGGSDSIIKYDGSYNFKILSDITTLASSAGSVTWGVFGNNGVELYYGNSKKFETLGTGVTVTGTTFTNQLSVSGVSTFSRVQIPTATTGVVENISNKLILGNDLNIFSTSSNNYILADENPLSIGVVVEDGGPVTEAFFGLVDIYPSNDVYYGNNSYVTLGFGTEGTKLRTLGAGATVTGTTFTNQLSVSGVSTFSGSVGIGTTNPTSKLTVVGDFVSGDPNDNNSQFKVDSVGNASISPGRLLYLNGPTNTNVGLKWTNAIGIELYNLSNLGGSDRNITLTSGNGGSVVLDSGSNSLRVTSSGVDVTSGISTFSGNVKVGVSTAAGVILTSPNGTKYQLFVENDGTLKTVAV